MTENMKCFRLRCRSICDNVMVDGALPEKIRLVRFRRFNK